MRYSGWVALKKNYSVDYLYKFYTYKNKTKIKQKKLNKKKNACEPCLLILKYRNLWSNSADDLSKMEQNTLGIAYCRK